MTKSQGKPAVNPRDDDSAEGNFPAPSKLQRPPCGTQSGDALGVNKYEGGGLGRTPAHANTPGNPFQASGSGRAT